MTALRTIIPIAAACAALLCLKLYSAGKELVRLRDSRPRIATIDFYGLQHVRVSQLRAELGLHVGDAAPVRLDEADLFTRLARPLFGVKTKESLEPKLREIPAVRDAASPAFREAILTSVLSSWEYRKTILPWHVPHSTVRLFFRKR